MRQAIYQHLRQEPPSSGAAAAPLPASPGVLGKNYIQSRIQSDFIPLASQCYDSLLASQPGTRGKAVLSFTIVGDQAIGGIVESAELSEGTTLSDPEFATCMRESMLSMTFEPPTKEGGWVTVTYPFELTPE